MQPEDMVELLHDRGLAIESPQRVATIFATSVITG